MPSSRDNPFVLPVNASTAIRIDVAIAKGMSRSVCSRLMVKGKMAAVAPRMSKVLQMFEPITLPNAMSPCPVIADDRLMNNSGDEVPIPIMVNPIMKLLKWAFLAIATVESTSTLAPTSNNVSPMMSIK